MSEQPSLEAYGVALLRALLGPDFDPEDPRIGSIPLDREHEPARPDDTLRRFGWYRSANDVVRESEADRARVADALDSFRPGLRAPAGLAIGLAQAARAIRDPYEEALGAPQRIVTGEADLGDIAETAVTAAGLVSPGFRASTSAPVTYGRVGDEIAETLGRYRPGRMPTTRRATQDVVARRRLERARDAIPEPTSRRVDPARLRSAEARAAGADDVVQDARSARQAGDISRADDALSVGGRSGMNRARRELGEPHRLPRESGDYSEAVVRAGRMRDSERRAITLSRRANPIRGPGLAAAHAGVGLGAGAAGVYVSNLEPELPHRRRGAREAGLGGRYDILRASDADMAEHRRQGLISREQIDDTQADAWVQARAALDERGADLWRIRDVVAAVDPDLVTLRVITGAEPVGADNVESLRAGLDAIASLTQERPITDVESWEYLNNPMSQLAGDDAQIDMDRQTYFNERGGGAPGEQGERAIPVALSVADRATVPDMQARLNERGFDAGPTDGRVGDQTLGALRRLGGVWDMDLSPEIERLTGADPEAARDAIDFLHWLAMSAYHGDVSLERIQDVLVQAGEGGLGDELRMAPYGADNQWGPVTDRALNSVLEQAGEPAFSRRDLSSQDRLNDIYYRVLLGNDQWRRQRSRSSSQ